MTSSSSWQPSASLETLRMRAKLFADIRAFFAQRGVMEVDTPILSRAFTSDTHLELFSTQATCSGRSQSWYLQPSPEFAMKRLLCADSGAIYQMGKVFRSEEQGKLHNPEFTLLEWYRPGWTDTELMDEVQALISPLIGESDWQRKTYRELFIEYLEVDPHSATDEQVQGAVTARVDLNFDEGDRDLWLEIALSHLIEPNLIQPTWVTDFPASQCALAQLKENDQGEQVAARFELYIGGVELANGYVELTDPSEQEARMFQRVEAFDPESRPEIDRYLLAALESGMPETVGIALGVDRLLMLQQGLARLAEAVPFSFERA